MTKNIQELIDIINGPSADVDPAYVLKRARKVLDQMVEEDDELALAEAFLKSEAFMALHTKVIKTQLAVAYIRSGVSDPELVAYKARKVFKTLSLISK